MKAIDELLEGFSKYLSVRRKRASSTVKEYIFDAKIYIQFHLTFIDDLPEHFTITKQSFLEFHDYLFERGISDATLQRRLIGVRRFWSYLYKEHKTAIPAMTFDDLDIVFKKRLHPTRPLSQANFSDFRKVARRGLDDIY